MSAYQDLMVFQRETEALSQVAGRLGWDQETMMPRDAAPQRGEEMAAMETVLHARRTDPQVADWLAKAETSGEVEVAQLRHIRRSFERASKVPAKLASEIARVTSQAQGKWAEAREADDFKAFAPVLKDVVSLKREEGAALSAGGDVYDAMLDDYEAGATAAELSSMFDAADRSLRHSDMIWQRGALIRQCILFLAARDLMCGSPRAHPKPIRSIACTQPFTRSAMLPMSRASTPTIY
jgi:carboxypeptidase Taq